MNPDEMIEAAKNAWAPPIKGEHIEYEGRDYVLLHAGRNSALFRIYPNGKAKQLQRWPAIWARRGYPGQTQKYGPGNMCAPSGCMHA